MSIVIEMLNDKGEVYEECEAHACIGDSGCEQPAVCEDHGDTGSPENPVYVWTAADGFGFFACARALAADDFARIKSQSV